MKERDPRYAMVKEMFEVGAIKSFHSIFNFIPKTVVAKDMGTAVERFTHLMFNPIEFKLSEIKKLATLFGQDFRRFLDLVLMEIK